MRAHRLLAAAVLAVLVAPVAVPGTTALAQDQVVSLDWLASSPLRYEHLWDISLTCEGAAGSVVYLHVEVCDAARRTVFVANTQDIRLAHGEDTLSADGIRLSDIWTEDGFDAFATPGSLLPDGDYTYTVTLVPEMTTHTFPLRVRKPKPLAAVWPMDEAEVQDSFPLFAWTEPVLPGIDGEFVYSLRLVEVGGGEACSLALRHNDCVLEECNIPGTAFRYPRQCTRLEPGRTYAWQVQAWDSAGVPVDTECAWNRVGSFVYKPGRPDPKLKPRFIAPDTGKPFAGQTLVRVAVEPEDAGYCVLEYLFPSDTGDGSWMTIGVLERGREHFCTSWDASEAAKQAGVPTGRPCRLRATVLGNDGQWGSSVMQAAVQPQPKRRRRGCGCR